MSRPKLIAVAVIITLAQLGLIIALGITAITDTEASELVAPDPQALAMAVAYCATEDDVRHVAGEIALYSDEGYLSLLLSGEINCADARFSDAPLIFVTFDEYLFSATYPDGDFALDYWRCTEINTGITVYVSTDRAMRNQFVLDTGDNI